MFYRKDFKRYVSEQVTEDIDFHSQNSLLESDNVFVTSAGLRSLGCMKQIPLSCQPVKVLMCVNETLYFIAKDGLYSFREKEKKLLDSVNEGCCVMLDNDVIFSSAQSGTYRLTEDSATELFSSGHCSMDVAGERLLALDGDALTVLPAGNAEVYEGSISINTSPACRAAVSLENKLYALGDTCFVHEPKAEPIDSRFRAMYKNIGVVSPESVVPMGKEVIFASNSGLYKLTVGNVQKICSQLDGTVSFADAAACKFRGRYLVSCKRNLSGPNDITLLIDTSRQQIEGVFQCGFDSLSSSENSVYAIKDNVLIRLDENGGLSRFKIKNMDMGSQKIKHLDRILLLCPTSAEVRVSSDYGQTKYLFEGSEAIQYKRINGRGRRFAIEVLSSNAHLQLLQLHAHISSEV